MIRVADSEGAGVDVRELVTAQSGTRYGEVNNPEGAHMGRLAGLGTALVLLGAACQAVPVNPVEDFEFFDDGYCSGGACWAAATNLLEPDTGLTTPGWTPFWDEDAGVQSTGWYVQTSATTPVDPNAEGFVFEALSWPATWDYTITIEPVGDPGGCGILTSALGDATLSTDGRSATVSATFDSFNDFFNADHTLTLGCEEPTA